VFFRENTEYGKQADIPRAFYIDAELRLFELFSYRLNIKRSPRLNTDSQDAV